jgi:2',3'-cyclic-nucleotide 2'-phosphodiesterase
MPDISLFYGALWIILGVALGALAMFYFIHQKQKKHAHDIVANAEDEAKKIIERAEKSANIIKKEIDDARADLKDRKKTFSENERKLEEKEQKVDRKYEDLEYKQNKLLERERENEKIKNSLEEEKKSLQTKIEDIAQLTEQEAREELLKITEEKYEKDILARIEKKKKDFTTQSGEMAREILISAIQQYAGEVTNEATQTIFPLESDDLKGKLIGKEGRNIIAFERATGVSLIIDDSPDTVFLSSFDLFRRYIAKKSLEDLIADKRIQPARIEEIVEKNQQDAEKLIRDLGQKTIDEMGIIGIPEDLYPLIGKFRFRASYGQNLLLHSKEVAYIARSIAKLIGADADLAFK